jgi:hypothetical protein
MHADLAVDYFQARSLDAQEQLLNSTVQQYEQALELNQSRFEGGIASEVEVQQAKTQLQSTRAAAIDVGVLRAQFEHAVAILLGVIQRVLLGVGGGVTLDEAVDFLGPDLVSAPKPAVQPGRRIATVRPAAGASKVAGAS